MSLTAFKRKSVINYGSKRSGIPPGGYWLPQGPFGHSTQALKDAIHNFGTAGFSLNGGRRNIGGVGAHMRFSKSATPYRGIYPKGWGGTQGRYPDGPNEVSLNIMPVLTGVAVQNSIVKPPVLSTKGMLARRFRWINSGQYPNNWVQPVYTGNQTDTASQGLYIQNKSASNYCWYDVNNAETYVNYIKNCGSTGCQTTPARGYTMSIQQANAPYTKTLHQPKDSSDYTLRIQRRCQNPVGFQKPFPYAVQNGTGVLRGGINVNNVANACNTSNTVTIPPDWYTGAAILKADGSKTTLKDQLEALRREVVPALQGEVYDDLFLKGTSRS